jgi:hypothetical protein
MAFLRVYFIRKCDFVLLSLTSGFCRDVYEICFRFETTYRSESGFLTREYGTDTLSRNVVIQLPHDAA